MGIIGTNFYQIKADHVLSKNKLFNFQNYQIELTSIETKNFADRIERNRVNSRKCYHKHKSIKNTKIKFDKTNQSFTVKFY